MKVAQHQTVKIPSKTQFLARVNDYAPSNLRKTTNGFDSTMTSTAYRTFNNPSTTNENSTLALKNSRSASVKERPKTAKPTTVTKGQEKKKRAASAKPKTGPKRQKTSSAVSGSVNSLRSEGSIPSQNNLASREDESASENEPTHKKGSKSVSNERPNLPGNYEVPSYLYKGLFQNNYMMGDTIQVKDQDYNQVTYQKDYRDYEQEYKIHREAKGQENLDDYNYLDKKLALYKLLDDENMESKQQSRKLINLTETINGSHALLNPNYQPADVAFERLPGYIPGKRTISERERAAMFIQRVVRGIMTRQRIKKVKENLKKHLKGDLDADPYEIEFYDLNVPAFKKLIESQEGPLQPTKTAAQKADEYDPEKKLLTNTFYSLIRSPFFPEDPMDYYVLGETKDDQFAAFPKLIYEEQERRSKDVMLERKYNYLFEKPLMKDYKTDDKSVIKNFLKSNLASITNADLKVDKFKIEYKSPVKAKTKPVLSFSAKSPRSAEVNKPKKFSHMASGAKDEIHTEISEDYGDDFEQDSAIKESIQESYDMRNSVIKESIPYSYGDSKNNKSIINESIQESIESNSPIGKITKKMSNKSISEEIEATNSRRFDRNASFKSIEEEIPGSESTSPRHKKGQLKKVRSMEDEIEEDIPAKDSYGDEEFESLEESIQESIEKFQNSRSNSKMDKLNIKEVSTPSPQKKVEQPSKPSFTSSKPALFKPKEEKKEEKSAPLSQTMPASVQKQKPVEAATKPLSQTIAAAPRYEEREPVGYAGYDEYESRRTFARTEFATTSATKTAEVLFANFQKELEKMVYVDNLSKKVHTLESTIENIYNQKEINILHSLQNKVAGAPTSSLQPHSALTPSELENNSLVYLMKKYNTLERSIGSISNQLNFLINNFTGGAPVPGQSLAATGLKAPAARKPRPIIPVRKSQNVRIKDEASLKPAAQQVKEQGKENVVKPKEQIKEVIKPKEVSPVKQKEVSPIKPQVKEGPKELPKPVSIKEDKPKPKFQFKFSEPKIQDKEEEEIEEIVEEEVPELPVNVPVKPVNVVKAQEKPKPVAVEEAKKLPDLTKPVPSMTKSAKFGKWQESSSESVIDEAESKRAKTPEDEEDFSVKEYSDTSDKPVHRVLPSAVPKAEEKKEITMPLTLPSKLQPVKKPDSPKKIQDESESIIDEVLDIPVEDIDEPSTHRNVKGKEATKAKAEDDDYYDDEFEELSYHSEPKEEKPAPVVQKSPKVEKRMVPEVSPIPEKSVSSDVEASQDLSIISWQETMATAEAAMAQKAEAQKAKVQEKKVEDVTNAVMQSILQDLSKDLFPKRNFAQIEEVKSKLKHVHIAEQQIFNVHQETPEMAQAAAEKLNQSQVKEEDVKHNKYTDNIKKELEVLTNKMSQAKKSQIIAITINHINFSDPTTKFTIFDKNPVKDESIADAYNEIFLKLFRSEFRKLNNEFATTKDVEKTMMIKMDNLINKSKDILIKKIGQAHSETEEYQKLSKRFDDMYETLRHKKMVGEENDFFEEEEDVKRLMEEENNKMKESVADQVMETLFEEAVQDLINLGKSRGNKKRY